MKNNNEQAIEVTPEQNIPINKEENELVDLMSSELDTCRQVYSILKLELDSLQEQSIEVLTQLTKRKESEISKLKELANQRINKVCQLTGKTDQAEVDWQTFSSYKSIIELRDSLRLQYTDNKRLSEQLLNLTYRLNHRVKQKLELLRGNKENTKLYSEKGKANSLTSSLNKVIA